MINSAGKNSAQTSDKCSLRDAFREKLALKFMGPTVIVMVVVTIVFGWLMIGMQESEVRERADREAAEQTGRVLETLQTVDTLSTENVQAAIKVLMQEGQQVGVPETGPSRAIAEELVPDLRLGRTSQLGNFQLVDRAKNLLRGDRDSIRTAGK